MTKSNLNGRVTALEVRSGATPSYVVHVRDVDDVAAVDVAIAAHRSRTGYRGPVIVAPPEARTVDEWLSRYAPGEGAT